MTTTMKRWRALVALLLGTSLVAVTEGRDNEKGKNRESDRQERGASKTFNGGQTPNLQVSPGLQVNPGVQSQPKVQFDFGGRNPGGSSPKFEGNFQPQEPSNPKFGRGQPNDGRGQPNFNPGTFNPGTVNPGTINPGTLNPGTINPGTGNPNAGSNGRFGNNGRNEFPFAPKDSSKGPSIDLGKTIDLGNTNTNPGSKRGQISPGLRIDSRPDNNRNPNLNPNLKDNSNLIPNLGGKIDLPRDLSRDMKPGVKISPPTKIGKNGQVPQVLDPKVLDIKARDPKLADGKKPLIDLGGKRLDRPTFNDRVKTGDLTKLTDASLGKKFNFGKQFDLFGKGDVARQMGFHQNVVANGGWRKFAKSGPIHSKYTAAHFGCWYPGHGCYPSYCWMPHWCEWVDWCWWDFCSPVCDPRPIWCSPIYIYDPCPIWVYCDYPVWEPLPIITCGTWVDVPVVVVDEGLDLQLLATRFVDPGHPEKNLGPRYRVWLRNTSKVDIIAPFNVLLMASNDGKWSVDLPQAGARLKGMKAGEIQPVDIRLPITVNTMGMNEKGQKIPFSKLHVSVDSHQEIPEVFEANNGAMLARGDILTVDPVTFSADADVAKAGDMLTLAGEGFGPEPGQVIVYVKGLEMQAEIHGWYDLGIRVKLPNMPLADATSADIVVVRGDGAVANALPVTLAPSNAEFVLPEPLP